MVEASWVLGDRVLYHAAPHLRGDDVAELQSLLTRLGFDCGRVDGIFGPVTARAVTDFQRNCGLAHDGACGRDTVQALQQLSRHTGSGPGVATVREVETLRHGRSSLQDHRLVIGHFGGLGSVVRAVARMVRRLGANVITLDDPDPSLQAAATNRFDAEVYLGLEAHTQPTLDIAYYSVPTFTSPGGHSLAHLLGQGLSSALHMPTEVVGRRLPILRETKMPAVMLSLGPVRHVVDHAPDVALAIATAVDHWVRAPQPTGTHTQQT